MRGDITVCVATYKRPEGLERLLASLMEQETEGLVYRIVVVDNDAGGSAREVVRSFQSPGGVEISYDIEPVRGIARARNRCLRLAKGDFAAFVDDDEKVCGSWLKELYECLIKNDADAVLGPVAPALPAGCPLWIRKGGFFKRPEYPDNAPVVRGRTCNALVKKKWLDLFEFPFDPGLGLTGDDDSDFFDRIRGLGARFHWAQNARVTEFVEKERLAVKWLLLRAFRGGQGFAARNRPQKLAGRLYHYGYRSCLCLISLAISCCTLPFALHVSVAWLRRASSNLGQVSVLFPYRYEEYRRRS